MFAALVQCALQEQITCTDTTCVVNFSVSLANYKFTRLPANPCANLSFKSSETFGVPLAD